ncbi:MAG: IS1380 family transposase, partial [Gammaproteobacteria bacterium]|nr:IS1380 family transposase [Gammaproteobacteria bacterium]
MMQQVGLLPFKFQPDHPESKLTSFSGLPLHLDMVLASGLDKKIQETLSTKSQEWNDVQIIISLICLNLVGGTSVEDIDRMENDQGFRELVLKIETYGMTRKARREHQRRWRKQKQRALPSSSVLRRYLEKFHHAEE